jgi:hypothetical protein
MAVCHGCRRQFITRAHLNLQSTAAMGSSSAGALPRFMLLLLTPSFWLLALDTFVTRPRPWVVWASRIAVVVFALGNWFFWRIAYPIWTHWCCYGADTSIYDLTDGFCASTAGCSAHSASPEFWVGVAWVGVGLVAVGVLGAARAIVWHEQVHRAALGDAETLRPLVRRMARRLRGVDQAQLLLSLTAAAEEFTDGDAWRKLQDRKARSPVLLRRSRIFFLDPWCFVTAMPAAIADLPAWHMLVQLAASAVWITCFACLHALSLPPWRRTCCHVDDGTPAWASDARTCVDVAGDAYFAQRECGVGTWTWDMWVEYVFGYLALAVALVNYLVVFVLYLQRCNDGERRWITTAALRDYAHTHLMPKKSVERAESAIAHADAMSEALDKLSREVG